MNRPRIRPRRLVLVGSILVDVLLYVDHLPERGGDRIARDTILTSGGGFNVLADAARLGLPVCHAGRIGDGPMGTQVMRDLREAGIASVLPQVQGEDTGFDVGMIEEHGERTFVTAPGTEARLTLADLQAISLQAGDVVYVSGYDLCYPVSGHALETWLPVLADDYLLIIDPGPLVAEIPAGRLAPILARTDILSLNERELHLLVGQMAVPAAAHLLVQRLAPGGCVIARVGEQGCWFASETQMAVHIPGRVARVVDTTGAGDAHVAAFLACLAIGEDWQTAVHRANIAASLSVEHPGPATGPTLAAWQEALRDEN